MTNHNATTAEERRKIRAEILKLLTDETGPVSARTVAYKVNLRLRPRFYTVSTISWQLKHLEDEGVIFSPFKSSRGRFYKLVVA